MEIIVPDDSRSRRRPISKARRGLSPAPTSNSGFKAQFGDLKLTSGLEASAITPAFSGKHETRSGVANKDYEAAARRKRGYEANDRAKVIDPC